MDLLYTWFNLGILEETVITTNFLQWMGNICIFSPYNEKVGMNDFSYPDKFSCWSDHRGAKLTHLWREKQNDLYALLTNITDSQ